MRGNHLDLSCGDPTNRHSARSAWTAGPTVVLDDMEPVSNCGRQISSGRRDQSIRPGRSGCAQIRQGL
jgi:hypothetical protein